MGPIYAKSSIIFLNIAALFHVMDAQALSPTLPQSRVLEASGLERVIQLTERPDFPGKATTKNLAQYVDSLQKTDQPFYEVLYRAIQGYAEGVKAEEEYINRKYFANSKKIRKIVYNTVLLPMRPLVALGNVLARKTKCDAIGTVWLGFGLLAELGIAGTVGKYINESIGTRLQGWTILGFATAMTIAFHYHQHSAPFKTYQEV